MDGSKKKRKKEGKNTKSKRAKKIKRVSVDERGKSIRKKRLRCDTVSVRTTRLKRGKTRRTKVKNHPNPRMKRM